MDMRFYPPPVQPPSATDPSCPDPSRRFDPLCCHNKLVQESMYMCTSEIVQDFSPISQVCPVSGLGDEDLGIPPIAPSPLTESPYPPASDGGAYHSHLPPRAQSRHNGLHPFNSLTMDSPGVNISSTLSQNGDPAPSFLSVQMDDFRPSIQSVMVQQSQLTTINQSQLSPHLDLSGRKVPHDSPSPPGSKRASLSPLSSIHEDESEEAPKSQGGEAEKRQAANAGKKAKAPKKKRKKDPNEPQKPVSAYALFFRDTQASIKGQKPGATFGEVSKIVASTWDSLDEEEKQLYKKKTEAAKTEYLKQLAAYRASLVSQSRSPSSDVIAPESSSSPGPFPRSGPDCGVYPGLTHPQQAPAPLRLPGSKMESLMSFPRANMASQMSPHGANMASPKPQLQSCLPGANMAASMPPSGATMAASSAPTQPMMHRCTSLQHQQRFASHLGNQRPLSNHHQHLPLHLQSFASGFPPPAEFRGGMFNGFSAGGLALIPPMDYIQSGCRDSSTEGVDWSTDYSSSGSLLG